MLIQTFIDASQQVTSLVFIVKTCFCLLRPPSQKLCCCISAIDLIVGDAGLVIFKFYSWAVGHAALEIVLDGID
jgi:hypothetical protein